MEKVMIKRFEDIEAWQEARQLNNMVYELLKKPCCQFEFCLQDQIKRASISIMANIAEGFERRTDRSFAQFLNYAIASASELQSHLYVALDQGLIDTDEFEQAYEKITRIKGLAGAFIRYLRKKDRQS
jgi:four helix bundle protein